MLTATNWIAAGSYFKRPNGQDIFYRKDGQGPYLVLLHGFPTWSYDYAGIYEALTQRFTVVTFDFLGYGASDKPKHHNYSVLEQADITAELLLYLGIQKTELVIHDYGTIVGQELVYRQNKQSLTFEISKLHVLNGSIFVEAYRPTRSQKLLITPGIGRLMSRLLSGKKMKQGLNSVRGSDYSISDDEFAELWHGITLNDGHRLFHRLIRYNAERNEHSPRWEAALLQCRLPMNFVWGMADPVSGEHVLRLIRERMPQGQFTELTGVGHFPQDENPAAVAAAILSSHQS